MFRWIKKLLKKGELNFSQGPSLEDPKTSYDDLIYQFFRAQRVCAPDEYDLRQRQLLYTLAAYLIGRDAPKPEDKAKNDDLDTNRTASSGCCGGTKIGTPPGTSYSACK